MLTTMTIAELEKRKTTGTETEQAYYRQFGWDKIVIPSTYTNLTSKQSSLTDMFNRYYMFREVGSETLERWQNSLQKRMDTLMDIYERRYVLYAQYDTDMKNRIVAGSVTASGGQTRHISTPDAILNQNDNYADTLDKSNNTITYSQNGTVVEDVNRAMDEWYDIDDMLIREFEVCFLQILEG